MYSANSFQFVADSSRRVYPRRSRAFQVLPEGDVIAIQILDPKRLHPVLLDAKLVIDGGTTPFSSAYNASTSSTQK